MIEEIDWRLWHSGILEDPITLEMVLLKNYDLSKDSAGVEKSQADAQEGDE
jgi:hypothetical protein